MNPVEYNAIKNKKTNKHIQFDLSKNQTYIIDNDNSEYAYSSDNIPFIILLVFLLFIASTILAYINEYYVCAGVFCLFMIAYAIRIIYLSKYRFIVSSRQ